MAIKKKIVVKAEMKKDAMKSKSPAKQMVKSSAKAKSPAKMKKC
jgi:hypothetical protein